MSFPVGDWQFWVVTLAAFVAAVWLLAKVLPWRRVLGKPKRKGTRATLTVGGKAVGKDDRR